MTASDAAAPTCLLLVLPLPMFDHRGALWLDTQACNGLRLWLEHFDRVILCGPLEHVSVPPPATSEIRALLPDPRLEIQPLPSAYTPIRFARVLPEVRRTLGALMDRSTHLHFAIGGLFGDWGAVGALLAASRGRDAAVWTDRVESQVMRLQAGRYSGARRLYRLATAGLARQLERVVIGRSAMGLFHGMDTYRTYAGWSRNPQLVHDIHLGPEARIAPEDLAAKLARGEDRPLTIVYGGRAHPDKGMLDWIETLSLLAGRGVPFQATWYGDGPDWEAARRIVAERQLEDRIALPGSLTDREALMRHFREADLFLFCHKTLESPRCLVEALLSGTPIVGYGGDYPSDLISGHGGGVLTAADPASLAAAVAGLAADRSRLRALTQAAAADGHPMVDVEVFRHRSELIKSLRPFSPPSRPQP